jgi:glucokinase
VYLGGGIAPKMLDPLKGTEFLDTYLAKGRMRPLVESMPVHIITDDRAALLGAGRAAAEPGGSL